MSSFAARKPASPTDTQIIAQKTARLINRKVWLPKRLYDALPYFYLASGLAAFFATVYVNTWFWVLPHYALFSAGCIHLGIMMYRRRRAARAENDETTDS